MGSADHPTVSPTPSLGSTGSLEAGVSAPDLKLLFDAAPLGVFLSTIDGCYLFVNRAFVGLLGYDSAEEVLTLDASRDVFVDPGDCRELFARAAGGAASGADVRLQRRDGRAITASLQVHSIGDPYGRGPSFVGFATDVTSHRDAEQRLRESRDELARSNSQLRVVYEQVPAIVWSTDGELRFTSSQGKGLAILGLAPDQVVGMTVPEYLGDHEDLPRHRRALEGEPQRYETSFGKYRFTCSLDPLRDADGTIVGTIGTAMEITTQRQLEERLREAQKMEGLALLAGGVAHDFNNLLVGILGNAELALHEVPEEGRLHTFLERLRLSAQRASDLTNQLLAYSGRGRFVVEPIPLNELIEEMAGLLRISISKNVSLDIDLDPGRPTAKGDAAQIRQVVMNLITNASDAIDERGGTVSLRTRQIESLREASAGPAAFAAIEVTDDGCGMDEETRTRIFDPFFTTKFSGHGLGLAAVQGIIRGHGGSIEVESAPGRGTLVRVLLPAVPAVAVKPQPALAGAGPVESLAPGTRVLVVDDEETVRRVTVEMIEQLGLIASTATNGDEALAVLSAQPEAFDVVLLDMTMPGLSGEDTLARIRTLPHPPSVILVSGYDAHQPRRRPGDRMEAAFLKKPFLLEALARSLTSALKR